MAKENRYVDENKVSKITGRAVQTLRNDRFLRKGIPYFKVGRSVRYDLQEVIDYMESRRIDTKKKLNEKPFKENIKA